MIVVSIFWLNSGEESVVYNCQNVKLLPQVVELSVLAYMMIKCFHYLYESQQDERISSHAAVVSTFRLTERRLIFLLRVFWNWRLRWKQQAPTESCHCTEQKPTHKPLPVACPLKIHASSWHFLSTCLGKIGSRPPGPQFVFKLSGMMQEI